MSAYLTAVLADSPVHYWRLCDPGGQVAHDIGSSASQMGTNGPTALGYSGPVSDGGSFVTTLNNNCASIVPLTYNPPYTIELWAWMWGYNALQDILAWDDSTAQSFGLRFSAAGACSISVGTGSAVFNGPISFQAWHHFVAVVTSTLMTLYLDGASVASGANGGTLTQTLNLSIGNSGGVRPMQGAVAELAYYHAALSAARVLAHFNAADNTAQSPIYSAAGGLGGGGVSVNNPNYLGILQQILQSVRKLY